MSTKNQNPEPHTPGPWRIERYEDGSKAIAPSEGFVVCTMAVVPPERIEANARLIAAAPELLDACKKLHDALSSFMEGTDEEDYARMASEDPEEAPNRTRSFAAINASFRAINKATKGE